LSGKVAIVTGRYTVHASWNIRLHFNHPGANSPLGIGRATVHLFAESGCKAIFMCDLKDDHLETHKRELNLLYPDVNILPRKFDASDETSVKAVVEEALQKYGRLDIFFANAGIANGKLFTDTTDEEFMRMLKANTLSVFLAAKYSAKAMMKE